MDLMLLRLLYDLRHHHADTGGATFGALVGLLGLYASCGSAVRLTLRRRWRRGDAATLA